MIFFFDFLKNKNEGKNVRIFIFYIENTISAEYEIA
jgi:hypothetical protein